MDLGHQPPANAYRTELQLEQPEVFYPLKLYVCDSCWLVQVPEHTETEQLFSADYAYFSSVSTSWLSHAEQYVSMICDRLALDEKSFIVELAANDGYLLKFVQAAKIPCLGIEPTASTAAVARQQGIPILEEFFGLNLAQKLALEGKQSDLIIGNNVLAHVPDINDFVAGMKVLLKPKGVITLEFQHLMRLIQFNQFDTVYHEHFSYLSLITLQRILTDADLEVFDVEQLPTQGGSLRVYAQHRETPVEPISDRVSHLLQQEIDFGLNRLSTYSSFQTKADQVKNNFLTFLLEARHQGKTVAGYGAAAKGNTLLNYAGVKPDLLPFVCDAAPSKQGKYLPGSHILVRSPDALLELKPNYVVLLPWNLKDELATQLAYVQDWGGQLVTSVPTLNIS